MSYSFYNIREGAYNHRSITGRLIAAGIAVLFAVALTLSLTASAATTTVVVTGDTAAGENQPGWLFNRDVNTATPFEFNEEMPRIGSGSLYVKPIANDFTGTCSSTVDPPMPGCDKFIAEYFYLDSADDFISFSYDFAIGADNDVTDARHFYLNVYANLPETNVDNFYQCRFDYTPATGLVGAFDTFSIDKATEASRVQARGGATCPDKTEGLNGLPHGSTIRAFAINVGDTSENDQDLAGYLDNVVLTTATDEITFDFELNATVPATKQECKDGGWNNLGHANQGKCVSSVVANEKAKFKRP